MRILASANVLLLLAACARGDDGKPARLTSADQLAAASPDSAMKRRWREAAEKGQLPSLDSLPAVETRLTNRIPPQVVDSSRQPARPTIQQGVVATVRPFSTRPVEQYTGAFTVTNTTATSITGTLTGRREPFELHFKLPDTTQLAAIPANSQQQLHVRDEVDNSSLRRELILSSADRIPLLAYVSDGGMRPYVRRFEQFPLTLTQRPPARDSISPVTVALGGATATLRPGERTQLNVGGNRLGVLLLSSHWTSAERVETSEGDAYHVTVMIYRVR
ncbi:MAG: hypothetical protein AB1762_04770 [Gemmatimonadota bacterium]